MNGAGRRSKVFSSEQEIFFVLGMDGRTEQLSPYVEACVLRFMSVRVHVRVRVRTLVRSADFVRVRVRIRVRSLGKSRVRVRIRVRSLKKFRVRVRVCFGHGLGHKLMSELLSVSAQLCIGSSDSDVLKIRSILQIIGHVIEHFGLFRMFKH